MKHALLPLPDSPTVESLTAQLEELLRLVALGDVQAFEGLYARVCGPIYGLTRRILRDAAYAEEVTQEVLLWIWREATRFDAAKGSAMAWMMTIAHRRAVDRVRSEQATTARHERAMQLSVARGYGEVSERVLTELDREAVRQALSALTPMQRESVTLAYYEGHSYREVAELLGLPLGTVKTRIRDGLIRMRDHLNVTAPGVNRT